MTDEPAEAADAEQSPDEGSGDAAGSGDASREPVEESADSETGMGDFEPATDSMESDDSASELSDEESADTASESVDAVVDLQQQVEKLEADVADYRDRVAELEAELTEREEEIEDLERRLKHKQADFENYKKRAKKRQQQIRERATENFVERVVTVRDNLLRALDQDEGTDIRDGIEATLAEFDRILADENVEPIEPDVGTEVDPVRHEVLMRVESDQPEDTIAEVYQPGYAMAEKVVRPAQVTVSDGPSEPDVDSADDESEGDGDTADAEDTTESDDDDGSEPAADAGHDEHEGRDEDEQ